MTIKRFDVGPRLTRMVIHGPTIYLAGLTSATLPNLGASAALAIAAGAAGITVTNTIGPATNYLDSGGATNTPARYYRLRLVP